MKTEKSCGCIILKDNKVLLIGAKDNEGQLIWSFPKGHQEMNKLNGYQLIKQKDSSQTTTV